ncbi:hypothetical protein TMatcc_004958 [Talaromyces marneffei ATCC 18224]
MHALRRATDKASPRNDRVACGFKYIHGWLGLPPVDLKRYNSIQNIRLYLVLNKVATVSPEICCLGLLSLGFVAFFHWLDTIACTWEIRSTAT